MEQQVLVLCLSVTEAEAAKQQGEITKFMSTKKAAELLSTKAEKGKNKTVTNWTASCGLELTNFL